MFAVAFDDGEAVEWHATDGGARTERRRFEPSIYVDGADDHLAALADRLAADPKVAATGRERKFLDLRDDERAPVLRVDLHRVGEVRTLARQIRREHEPGPPGTLRLYDVDLSPGFRYCLATGRVPLPDRPLSVLSVRIGEKPLADRDVSRLVVDGEPMAGSEPAVLRALTERIRTEDPDVLVVDDAGLVPLLFAKGDDHGVDVRLGRRPGYEQLAGANTVESYGRVLHSPARYRLPGRVLVDEANSFLWSQTSLRGLLDLVGHAHKPLGELAWASIGNVLTAIQIREARDRDVLVPWNKWAPEQFKDVETLHAADRGGFTFAPEVGLHEDAVQLDFSSLYPRIICEHNLSPDTVRRDCDASRGTVPELDYEVCERRGFLVDVLEPLLDHRAALKDRLRETDDAERAAALSARSDAFKWVLVAAFGYQGYRNSKFGRIEVHEAINAVARDLLLTAKSVAETAGWRVVHGVVDSLWVTAREADPLAPADLADRIADAVGIPLEVEAEYDWVAFVPKRNSQAGALTKHFGETADGERTVRGIECRQRSTPAFVADAQRDLIDVLGDRRDPGAVVDRLATHVGRLRRGDVAPAELVIRKRTTKPLSAYSQRTHTVAALQRARRHGVDVDPGEDVRYVVVDDGARSPERVRLHFETVDGYDADFYADLLVRAAESVVSPLGWDREDVRRRLGDRRNARLDAFGA